MLVADDNAHAVARSALWANGTRSQPIRFWALDAAGKDGAIQRVMSGANPQAGGFF